MKGFRAGKQSGAQESLTGSCNPELGSLPWGCWPLPALGHKAGNSQSSPAAAPPVSRDSTLCKQRSEETKNA